MFAGSRNETLEMFNLREIEKIRTEAFLSQLPLETKRRLGYRNSSEVFLSFRGEDTRSSFTSHLYASLQNAGIRVFMDEDSLQRGGHISTLLPQEIERSKISIVVFSRNYADSRWCLRELVKIMECHRTTAQIVLLVFYDVDPSEVRHQTGEFGQAFECLLSKLSKKKKKKDKSPKWREALRGVAAFVGFVVLNPGNF